jgi:membrane protein implicated in regulation of membrane protease activity
VGSQQVVGRIGTVIHTVRGGERPGEVRVLIEGFPHYYIAYAVDPVVAGSDVLIINYRGARQVDVEPWSSNPADESLTGTPEGTE